MRLSKFTHSLIQQNEPLPWDLGVSKPMGSLWKASSEMHPTPPLFIYSLLTSNLNFPNTIPKEVSLGHKANLK